MHCIILKRILSKRVSDDKIKAQINHLLTRGLAGARGKTWKPCIRRFPPVQHADGNWEFKCQITIEKTKGQKGGDAEYKQWDEIKAMIRQTGSVKRYQPYPWTIVSVNGKPTKGQSANSTVPVKALANDPDREENGGGMTNLNDVQTRILAVREVQPLSEVKTWADLGVPPELFGPDSDRHLAEHPAWRNLYGVNSQIRIILSSIQRAHETEGQSRNHCGIFGHAGCGKSTTLEALKDMFGEGTVLRLDASSTTRAGLEKLFFNDLQQIPPLVFMEEVEKADIEALKIWLGALDDRGEIRKVNFKVNQLRQVKVLFICTVNNKELFDRMMGSDGKEAGALSSRCGSQVYYPRPNDDVLFQILDKKIQEHGGKREWIKPAIDLAKDLSVTDPRTVCAYLAGSDRLLNGTYQRDWLAVKTAEEAFGSK